MSGTERLAAYKLFIGGSEVDALSGASFETVDPTTGRGWATIAEAGAEDVDRAAESALRCFESEAWTGMSATRRGRLLMRLGDLILEKADVLAAIETRENGKLYKEMHAQLRVVPDWLYYFGGLADKVEGRVIPLDRSGILNYTRREPIGPVGIITPWNSPAFLTFMAAAPALAAGNPVVIKPSEVTSASILEIMRLAEIAGFPPGSMNVITGHRAAGEALVAHPGIAGVSFTGGTAAGRAVARTVGGRLSRYTLELGGKSANIVFDDAQIEAAESGVLAGIFGAAGQTCIAGSRALVQETIFEEFVERLKARAETILVGDPMNAETQMGPIATQAQLAKISRAVEEARDAGAGIVAGGCHARVPGLPSGLFYRPTVVTGMPNDSALAQEEIFGPVLTVIPFRDEADAVAQANATRYGLAAGVWTLNIKRAHRVAQRLEAGTVWINLYRAVAFNSPFGGYKDSGVGRLNGIEAIGEFLQTKSVWCELGEEINDPFVLRV